MADFDGSIVSPLSFSTSDGGFEYSVDGVAVSQQAAGGGVTYRMRGYDTTLVSIVYWSASFVDSVGGSYAGPGPVTDIVVHRVIGT